MRWIGWVSFSQVAEALALGLPVVGSAAGKNAMNLDHTGWRAESDDHSPVAYAHS